jgi:hypothetical protein
LLYSSEKHSLYALHAAMQHEECRDFSKVPAAAPHTMAAAKGDHRGDHWRGDHWPPRQGHACMPDYPSGAQMDKPENIFHRMGADERPPRRNEYRAPLPAKAAK